MQTDNAAFDPTFHCLIEPALRDLQSAMSQIDHLRPAERHVLVDAAAVSTTEAVRRKVSRLLLLELNAARVSGRLHSADSQARWHEFIEQASRLDFWLGLEEHYPTLLPRLSRVIVNRAAATLELGRRLASSRSDLSRLLGTTAAELTEVAFGAGDSHREGRSVAILSFQTGESGATKLVYKPRSLAVDRALGLFLDQLFGATPDRIRVPRVLNCASYGWTEYIEHSYCPPADLGGYYRRIGHWLGLARLFGTTDLHAENLIAAGPVPVLVDCETLFTPVRIPKLLGAGDAFDQAALLLAGSLLRSGLLPQRGTALGWRGIDMSAGASLPSQQPEIEIPVIEEAGTDLARLGTMRMPLDTPHNLPSAEPDLARYWTEVLAGFDALTERLQQLDRDGELAALVGLFADVDIRGVLRSTEAYAELGRMLWHPVSLHDEAAAVSHASQLLASHAESVPSAPSEPKVIAAEVADLLDGDIPYFQGVSGTGWLIGPRGTGWGEPHDMVADALARWRAADFAVEQDLIRSSVVCAYINDGYFPGSAPLSVPEPSRDRLAERRQQLAADIIERLRQSAIRGSDGTVTWVAPTLGPDGWSVQPLGSDGYSGVAGIALLLAAYRQELRVGRALPVTGLDELLAGTVTTLRAADNFRLGQAPSNYQRRPDLPGLYVGLGSQVWCWLELAELGVIEPSEGRERAERLAALMPEPIALTEEIDLLKGVAGAAMALLRLHRTTGDQRWLDLAVTAGERLVALARPDGAGVRWPTPLHELGLGGFAHGATGIGWALARLGAAGDRTDFGAVADAAFTFEETLWSEVEDGWRDIREESGIASAWCHGATGIGLASADLLRRGIEGRTDHVAVLRRAAGSYLRHGVGWNHTLCHGDAAGWELIEAAREFGIAPESSDDYEALLIGSVERHGPISGLARDAFVPGLMPGLSGVAYQFLRMAPESRLPSMLICD